MASLRLRAVKIAASLRTLAKSAPVNPGVRRAIAPRETSGAIFLSRQCTSKIPSLPLQSG